MGVAARRCRPAAALPLAAHPSRLVLPLALQARPASCAGMQWERAELTAPCLVCGLAIQPGERIFRPAVRRLLLSPGGALQRPPAPLALSECAAPVFIDIGK